MHPTSKIDFSNFLETIGIKGTTILSNCSIEYLRYYKQSRKLIIGLTSSDVIDLKEVFLFMKKIKNKLNLKYDIEVHFKNHVIYDSIADLIERTWENILYIIEKSVPSSRAILNDINWSYSGNQLIIEVKEHIIIQKSKERNVTQLISHYFKEHFMVELNCIMKINNDSAFSLESYEEQKRKENMILLNQYKSTNEVITKTEATIKSTVSENNSNEAVLLGKNFSGELTSLINITSDSGRIIVEGDLFHIETKELNGGKKLYTLQLTDYSNSITVKVFERKNQQSNFEETIHKCERLRIRGEITYDKFARENVLIASDILTLSKVERMDIAEDKRIELHLHTQMSAMDGMNSPSELIKRAAKWGHKAIAITDHGVVQAFPEAMEAGKKHNIKVIYGMEGYLINDQGKIVEGPVDYGLDDEYVVFDIETTGLSNKSDKITEIGAVKIREGKIIDTFSTLVNPEREISAKITELTGITNEMVREQPTIECILPQFLSFIGDSPLVAHNADFDMGFVRENCKKMNIPFNNPAIDTLTLARVLLPRLKRHKLDVIAKELGVNLENHHRAVDDAKATGEIFIRFIDMLKEKGLFCLGDINTKLSNKADHTKLNTYHIVILVKNEIGLKNLYRIVSESHINYFYKKPRIPKSVLNQYREGLILGTACEAGELIRGILSNKAPEEIKEIATYYDYLEIQPIENNHFLLEKGIVKSEDDLRDINYKIIQLGELLDKPVVATGDVHFLDQTCETFRKILMTGQGFNDADEQAPLYLKTTDEMLQEFAYLGKEKALEVVVTNPNKINEQIDSLIPIPEGTFPPEIDGSEEELRKMCYDKAERIYGNPLPEIVKNRLDREVNSIINNGYAVMYIIAQKLVTKSLRDGYLVGSRGSVGSSFAATMSDITEVNPLPPHYICPNCKYSHFILDGSYGSGADLPDKPCPKCNIELKKDGHDIPFEVFLGFEADKEPDIDLNFAGEYQSEAHKYTEELFGKGKVYRAGTIGTIADKTAYGFVKKYLEEKQVPYSSAEINRLTKGCTGVKRTSGQHPGGVMIVPRHKDIHDFCPIQYPANDSSSGVITTHFDYHSISGRLLKLDILGHDVPTIIKMLEDLTGVNAQEIPLDDRKTISIFTSTEALGIKAEELGCEVGTLGIPEFGTKFVRQMLIDTKPSTFAELVRISGLSHGTDVWLNNAQDLVRNNIAELKDVISTRDDIMNYLILKGLPPKASFKIMEKVRKGKGLTPEDEQMMKENDVPQWYIDSCNKIKYMFPKAHAAAYVMMSFRIAYFKVHYPLAFYATYFTTKAEDFDTDLIIKGKEFVKDKIKEIETLGNDATAKEKNFLTVLEVALEMYCRGIDLLPVDIYGSDADRFMIQGNKLLPPLKSLQGVGQNAARSIVTARQNGEFLSLEDLRERAKVTKTVIETLVKHGCLKDLPETNQLSLLSLF